MMKKFLTYFGCAYGVIALISSCVGMIRFLESTTWNIPINNFTIFIIFLLNLAGAMALFYAYEQKDEK